MRPRRVGGMDAELVVEMVGLVEAAGGCPAGVAEVRGGVDGAGKALLWPLCATSGPSR